MSEPSSDPFEFFKISKELLTVEQGYLPSGKFLERFAVIARDLAQAQLAYNQALMRANAALLGAFLGQPVATPVEEQSPSAAARDAASRAR